MNNPVALITGASRGLGRGIALELAGLGYNLVLNYAKNRPAAEQTARDCVTRAGTEGVTVRAEMCQADIAAGPDRERLIETTRATFGRLDLLVNNAGVAPAARCDLLEATEESFDRLMSVNVKGPYFLTQRAARWMIEQVKGERTAGGNRRLPPRIVTISSISAYTASVSRGEYCISKAALSMLTPLYAARLAEYGIQCLRDPAGNHGNRHDRRCQRALRRVDRSGADSYCPVGNA